MNDNSFFKGFAYTVAAVFALTFLTLMMLYGAWAGAFVSVHLWTWFVVPTFGLAPLKMPTAFGLALLVGLWTHRYTTGHKDERSWKEKGAEAIGHLIGPWFVLLCGYVCHHFFM
jgi:disulfide bond formation protein DsbB